MTRSLIEIDNLTKTFGSVTAVDGVSFEIRAGEAFGLLGPNGAGKTSTIHMLAGALVPDSGSITIGGERDPTRGSVKRRIGIAPQDLALYEELSGEANLGFFGRLYGMLGPELRDRVDWAIEFAGLTDRRRDAVAQYSGGMKRRLNLACALVHDPAVFFLDEPTVGVDPQSRNHLFDSIQALRDEGRTLIYTTHYMEEAQRLCDRVAIMDQGRILALDTVPALIAEHGGASVVMADLGGEQVTIETDNPLATVADLGKRGDDLVELRVDRPNLERVFLNLTGRSLRD